MEEKITPYEVVIFSNQTNQVQAKVRLTKFIRRPAKCLLATDAELCLVKVAFSEQQSRKRVQQISNSECD